MTLPQPDKRVLMIAYEFPPLAAGGVHRTVRFARYLPRFGWQPHVLTASNPEMRARDESLLDELPACAQVHRSRSWEYHVPRDGLVRLATALGGDRTRWHDGLTWRLRALYDRLAIPDHKIFWALPAVLRGLAVVARQRINAIYSTSWPYSDHIAGLILSRLTGRPLIVDFRDPWTQHLYYGARSPWVDRMNHRLERTICRRAACVVTPSWKATRAMRELFPDLPRGRFQTIRNGYDPTDFADQVEPSSKFDIVHTGTLYRSRQPDTFLDGLTAFLRRVPEAAEHTRVRFFGMSLDLDQSRLAAHEGIEVHGWTGHKEVVRALRESTVLLVLRHFEDWKETTVPAKAYEYLASGNHVLAIQQPQRELDGILRAYGNATILHDYQPQPVADVLTDLYRRWERGRLGRQTPPTFVQRFSREATAGQLANLLDRAVESAAPGFVPNRPSNRPVWTGRQRLSVEAPR
ncbi:MAG: glycosyltransferase family 4 protein [bacterium]|nr:glycosyltransferase family 4 protein [bacterium]